MVYVAHSVPEESSDRKVHLYDEHVSEVLELGLAQLEYTLSFSTLSLIEREQLKETIEAALMLHDMGKLDDENQEILRGEKSGRLPIDHIEAGVAIASAINNELVGWLIRGHHAPGLPSKKSEKFFIRHLNRECLTNFGPTSLRGRRHKRTRDNCRDDYFYHYGAILKTDKKLEYYKNCQEESSGKWPQSSMNLPQNGLLIRLMLSNLVNADHESTGCYRQNLPMIKFQPAQTKWNERLEAMKCYIESLPVDSQNDRHILRTRFYQHCLNREISNSKMMMCSAPVGLGKTTSVATYLLRKAIEDNSSRIIVIAPFSNIINQTVKTLRKAVVLDGENPEETVVAHHHKAEFSSESMRQYSVLWQAPVVVTTAVQFFETLASAHPSKLRKLNAIAGASIFIDESHACLPVELLKITWYWLKKLSDEWGCNIVFSSGSMVEFWNDQYFLGFDGDKKKDDLLKVPSQVLPDLFPDALKKKTVLVEKQRVVFNSIEPALKLNQFIEKIQSDKIWQEYQHDKNPSCLVILNTVQSSAIVADMLAREVDDYSKTNLIEKKVLYISTALAPVDRDKILKEIERRQKNSEWNSERWFLIATSAVEAGVDLDFSIGFRERASVTSFLQVSGRINRHGKRKSGVLYDVTIVPDDGLTLHPGFKESSVVFDDMWNDLNTTELSLTDLCTTAQRKEFSRFKEKRKKRDLLCAEEGTLNFQEVDKHFKLIEADTATVIIDEEIVKQLNQGIPVSWQRLQENSVQLWMKKIRSLKLNPIRNCKQDNIFSWTDLYDYDSEFLGIMCGIVKNIEINKKGWEIF